MSDAVDSRPDARRYLGTVVRVARIVLVVVVVAAAGYALWRNWSDVSGTISAMSWRTWLPSLLFIPVGIVCSTMCWQVFVDELGTPVGAGRGAQIYLVGQLGKYVPGSVWAYVLQLELGRRAGLARARIFTATVFSLIVAVAAALLTGSLAIPALIHENSNLESLKWLYVVLPIGLVCLHPRVLSWAAGQGFRILRRPAPDHPIRKRTVVRSLLWALASYACFGIHVWLLTRDTVVPTFENLGLTVGAMALAMISGLFFFILPSGAGIRETVLVAALAPSVGTGKAIAYAAISRVFMTAADVVMAGVAAALGAIENRRLGRFDGDPGLRDDF